MKEFCTCGQMDSATIIQRPTLSGSIIGVCGNCRSPNWRVWEKYIDLCDYCLGEFSNPWSDICLRCYRLSVPESDREDTPYIGWGTVRQERPPWQRVAENA